MGYAGGNTKNPTYNDVCSRQTGHAEVVEVDFDPSRVSYEELLKVFWESHNPTTHNRQGFNFGSQYRSILFYHSPEQQAAALAFKEKLEKSGRFRRPITTEMAPSGCFYRAEEYHQQYYEKMGVSSCKLN